jgi:hypothetical protein
MFIEPKSNEKLIMSNRGYNQIFPILKTLSNNTDPASWHGYHMVVIPTDLMFFYEQSPMFYGQSRADMLKSQRKTKHGHRTAHLMGLSHFINKLRGHKATPVFVMDFMNNFIKRTAPLPNVAPRTETENNSKLQRAISTASNGDIVAYLKNAVSFTEQDVVHGYSLLSLYGFPLVTPCKERTKQLAHVANMFPKSAIFDTIFPTFKYGVSELAWFLGGPKSQIERITISDVLKSSGLNMDQFLEVSLLLEQMNKRNEVAPTMTMSHLSELIERNRSKPVQFFDAMQTKFPRDDWELLESRKRSIFRPPNDPQVILPEPVNDLSDFRYKLTKLVPGIEDVDAIEYIIHNFNIFLDEKKGRKDIHESYVEFLSKRQKKSQDLEGTSQKSNLQKNPDLNEGEKTETHSPTDNERQNAKDAQKVTETEQVEEKKTAETTNAPDVQPEVKNG